MKNYVKPMVLVNEELAEGVYAASGCYTANAQITQTPEGGRENYCIKVDGKHADPDNKTCGKQQLVISFNKPVTYVRSNGNLSAGDGTNCLKIDYSYTNNANDNVGLGDVYVKADLGLAVTGCQIIHVSDNQI